MHGRDGLSGRKGWLALLGAAMVALVVAGCSQESKLITGDPITDLRNPELRVPTRVLAAEQAWTEAKEGVTDRAITRRAFKDLAWSPSAPGPIRLVCLEAVLSDESQDADSRQFVSLLLPTERDRDVVAYAATVAATRGWVECTTALVRCYSRPVEGVSDLERSERKALEVLHTGKPVEQIVFEVFLNPGAEAGPYAIKWDERARADAWDLLARLDFTGSLRAELLNTDSLMVNPKDDVVAALRACETDLSTLPQTGDELRWLISLREKRSARGWWTQASEAIKGLSEEQRTGLALRHAECVRWASVHHPEWLAMSSDELASEITVRIEGRKFNRRTVDRPVSKDRYAETIEFWRERLVWGDYLSVLVVNESRNQEDIVGLLFGQIELDRRDTTTEYGGVLEYVESTSDPRFRSVLFPPRPDQRRGDREFIASQDMIDQSLTAIAHYHFHAQTPTQAAFAGPSDGDLTYAARQGRTCVVYTSISETKVDQDVYLPNGAVIDLGELTRPR